MYFILATLHRFLHKADRTDLLLIYNARHWLMVRDKMSLFAKKKAAEAKFPETVRGSEHRLVLHAFKCMIAVVCCDLQLDCLPTSKNKSYCQGRRSWSD
ncbi:hypothetical protein AZ66_04790 [Paenibacillus sp. E194]|nr:hypothetical protein AZ66_04790 [Paenibacillus sp. E194]